MITITQSTFAEILILEIANRSKDQDPTYGIANSLFTRIAESPYQQIVLDLRRLSFVTSEIIGQLIMLNKKCLAHDRQLKVCGVSGANKMALKMVQFDTLVDMYDRKAQAIAAFKIEAQRPVQVEMDDGSANVYLEQAERGNLDVQFRYGKCLETGREVAQDFEAALKWYEKAAKQGHTDSQHALAVAYAYGIGVSQDFEIAFDWYKKAAEQGHADAQYMIGMSWQYGLIGEVDLRRASKWYNESAQQGYQPAKTAQKELNL